MKKILFIVVCCLMLCGCNANKEANDGSNSDSIKNDGKINFESKYLYCGVYTKDKNNTIYSYEWYEIYFNNEGNTSKICYTVLTDGKNLGTNCDMEISNNIGNYDLAFDYYKSRDFTCYLEDIE